MNRVLIFWLATLLVFAGGMLIWGLTKSRQATTPAASPAVVAKKLTDFELLDQTGKRVNSREFDGQVWAGSFFFSACPSTCYNQNIKLQQLYARYVDQGLRLMSITCDPGNDTPVTLAGYASRFNADPKSWKFLTPADGDAQYITRIANEFFSVAVGPQTHTDRVVLFDRTGKILGSYSVLDPDHYRELDKQIQAALAAAGEPETQTRSSVGDRSTADDASAAESAAASSGLETANAPASANR